MRRTVQGADKVSPEAHMGTRPGVTHTDTHQVKAEGSKPELENMLLTSSKTNCTVETDHTQKTNC